MEVFGPLHRDEHAVLDFFLEHFEPGVARAVLEPELNVRHVADVDGCPVRSLHDEVLNLLRIIELAINADEVVQPVDVDGAAGDVGVLALDRGDEVVEGEAVALERVQVDVDLHLALKPADKIHFEHARDAFDLVLKVFGGVAKAGQRIVCRQVDRHDRELARVDLAHDRLLDFGGELGLGDVHLFADLLRGVVHIDVRQELDDHGRDAFGGRRTQFVDAVDRGDLALNLLGDDRLDVVRAGPRVDRRDDDSSELDLRLGLLGNGDVGVQPADDEERSQNHNRDPVLDGDVGDFHGLGRLAVS